MQLLTDWLQTLGFNLSSPVLDGKIHRFGKEKEFWFIGSESPSKKDPAKMFQIATVGNWKTGEKFHYKTDIKLSKEENAAAKEQFKRALIEAEKQKLEEQEAVALKVQESLKELSWAEETAYTKRKNIFVHELCKSKNGDIVIPIRDIHGKVWTVQRIAFDGTKLFYPGGKMQGNFFLFGEPTDTLYICEGYATGASIYTSTGKAVACAMNAGNMPSVASAFRKKYPKINIIMAADNDVSGVGKKKAEAAAENVGALVVLPPEGVKDFNDAGGLITGEEHFVPDFASPLPDMGGAKGDIPLCTMENIEEIFKRSGIVAKYDLISKRQLFSIPGENHISDDWDNSALTIIASKAAQFGISSAGNVRQLAVAIANRNPYNPVINWITSRPWDGKFRMPEFCDTIKAKNESSTDSIGELKRTLISKWMRALVAAAFEPRGFSAPGVLVLQGNQALGKTSWLKALVPEELGLMKDGLFIKPDNRDSVKIALGFWIVELGELDGTFRKADIAQLKAFLTADKDVMRQSHMMKESYMIRRTGFCATVNNKEFLNDNTGNRRFWTIECESINFRHGFDMQQVWAEVYEGWKINSQYHLTKEELDLLNESNQSFESLDPIKDLVVMGLSWGSSKANWKRQTVTEILRRFGKDNPNRDELNRAAKFLRDNTMAEPSDPAGKNIKWYFAPTDVERGYEPR